ncbi:hypothetical protein GCM10027084_10830 [Pseudoxanthomonas sangjuensis]|uniref:GGDEF domain-containing protein n=1 Tax=Pseudoxanthomonas sangjuensis TaxID=1503750 RepID=UPI00139132E9|nr:GGDEF domain-containing protein [Pseudoxanthomonas sangjuensis]KAF1711927.1 hypothetical protein CSC71_09630 [Pseudoxanthomonas sangjuensis]
MTTDFHALLLGDNALALLLLVLFWYVARVSSGLRGIALWGIAHLVYTIGASLLDGTAPLLEEAGDARGAWWAANLGGLLASSGIAGLAWAVVQFVEQRGPRPGDVALMAFCVAVPLGAWIGSGTLNAQGGAMSASEVVSLLVSIFHLRRLRDVPALLPARLIMLAMAVLVFLYARDLGDALGGRYGANEDWVDIDLPTWFLLNFCMLMLSSFRAAESLRHVALVDPLTDALNRRGLGVRLRGDFVPIGSRGSAVIALDLDRFKLINDRHGHPAGDAVLRCFSDAVRTCIRSGDLFARVGGEEFVVVLHDISADDALGMAERIRREVARQQIAEIAPDPITVSVGVATGADADGIDTLMLNADEALYEAKRLGRNHVRAWRPAGAANQQA